MNPTSRFFLNFQVFNITVLITLFIRLRQEVDKISPTIIVSFLLVVSWFCLNSFFANFFENSFEFSHFFFNSSALSQMIMMSSAILGSSRVPFQLRTILPSWVWIFILPLFTCIVEISCWKRSYMLSILTLFIHCSTHSSVESVMFLQFNSVQGNTISIEVI